MYSIELTTGEAQLRADLESYRNFPVANWDSYEFFGLQEGDEYQKALREQTKQAFLQDEVRNPQIYYPKLANSSMALALEIAEERLIETKSKIDVGDAEPLRAGLASDIVAAKHLEIVLLQISQDMQDGTISAEDRTHASELFSLINDDVYGELEQDRFLGLWNGVLERAHDVTHDKAAPTLEREAAEYILEHTGETTGIAAKEPVRVDDEVIGALRSTLLEVNADILSCIPELDGRKITFDEFMQMFRDAHATRQTGWNVKVEPGKASVDTRQSEETTYIGSGRIMPNVEGSATVLLHENGVHVERRIRGDNTGDPLLAGVGLEGYLASEEGMATIFEQIYRGKQTIAGTHYYIALGLARGLDNSSLRDFRDVFEIDWRRRILEKFVEAEVVTDADVESCKSSAYTTCFRIFRGTPCDIPGMVYTKDQSYFMGNQKMWEIFTNISQLSPEEQKDEFEFLLAAKFDPTNPDHCKIVERSVEATTL